MEDQFSGFTANDMFENGVAHCHETGKDAVCTEDTLRAFVDPKHHDWEAARLKAHHIDTTKLHNWLMYGPGGTENSFDGPNEDIFYAVVHSAQGSSNVFVVNDQGTLRVFLQHAVNHWKNHRKCRLVFYNRRPTGAVVCAENVPETFFDEVVNSEDGRN